MFVTWAPCKNISLPFSYIYATMEIPSSHLMHRLTTNVPEGSRIYSDKCDSILKDHLSFKDQGIKMPVELIR